MAELRQQVKKVDDEAVVQNTKGIRKQIRHTAYWGIIPEFSG